MTQMIFTEFECQSKMCKTRHEVFLNKMGQLIPWVEFGKDSPNIAPVAENKCLVAKNSCVNDATEVLGGRSNMSYRGGLVFIGTGFVIRKGVIISRILLSNFFYKALKS